MTTINEQPVYALPQARVYLGFLLEIVLGFLVGTWKNYSIKSFGMQYMFKRSRPQLPLAELTPEQLAGLVTSSRDQNDMMLSCMRVLCYLIKDFTFDLPDIDADGFKERMDSMVSALNKAHSPNTFEKVFGKGKTDIITFTAQEREYIYTREAEFKSMFDYFKSVITNMLGENRTFNTQVHEQHSRIESIIKLEDIRQMRDALHTEVETMRTALHSKQEADNQRIEALSKEVKTLDANLHQFKQTVATDTLTNACTRSSFDVEYKSSLVAAEVGGKPISLLMCDIDDFKIINDSFGHQTGDVVLQMFVREAMGVLRKTDIIARYGGDEFAIMLPNASLRHALRVAKRIRETVASRRYLYQGEPAAREFSFTVSIGVAESHRRVADDDLISRADRALYVAKNAGKNCVRTEKNLEKLAA